MEQIWTLVVLVSFAGVQHFIDILLTNNIAAKTKAIIAYDKKGVVHYNSVVSCRKAVPQRYPQPEPETANILRRHRWFLREMSS